MKEKIECSVAIQVLPLPLLPPGDAESTKVIAIVDEVISYIRSMGLKMKVGPFETTVEGDFDTLMSMVKECQLICIRAGAPMVMSYVKISYAPDGLWGIKEKTAKHEA